MSCRSGKVQVAASKSVAATDQLEKLQSRVEQLAKEGESKFYAEIDAHLKSADIDDATEIHYEKQTKVEYASEFSLDTIAQVVKDSLKAIGEVVSKANDKDAALTPEKKNMAAVVLSQDAVNSYCKVIDSVAQAAKSSSKTSSSLSFSMIRLSPGVIAFLSATSTSLMEKDTFGTEAITATTISYRIMRSVKDLENEFKFFSAQAAMAADMKLIQTQQYLAETADITLKAFKTLQIGLLENLMAGTKTITEYMTEDAIYKSLAAAAEADLNTRLNNVKQLTKGGTGMRTMGFKKGLPIAVIDALKHVLSKLSGSGSDHKLVVELNEKRLAEGYFA